MQQLRAVNDYYKLKYTIYYWKTTTDIEVDFVLYGPRGIKVFEIKLSKRVKPKDLKGLRTFKKDYPDSDLFFVYGGNEELYIDDVRVIPADTCLKKILEIL